MGKFYSNISLLALSQRMKTALKFNIRAGDITQKKSIIGYPAVCLFNVFSLRHSTGASWLPDTFLNSKPQAPSACRAQACQISLPVCTADPGLPISKPSTLRLCLGQQQQQHCHPRVPRPPAYTEIFRTSHVPPRGSSWHGTMHSSIIFHCAGFFLPPNSQLPRKALPQTSSLRWLGWTQKPNKL